MKNFLKKIQSLPESKRKMIFWFIIIVLGITLFIFYIKGVDKKIKSLQGGMFSQQMNIDGLKENFNNVPTQEMGDAIKQIQDILNQNKIQNENETQQETKTE